MTGSNQAATDTSSPEEQSKRAAAEAALSLVESGMVLGLGTGSTARYVIEGVARRLTEGALTRIRGVPTSEETRTLAEELGIPLIDLPADGVDLGIDGMDEVAPNLDAIKGLGGALLREKIVATSAHSFVLIGDERKPVSRLGERSPLPVEILSFGHARTVAALKALELEPALRERGGRPYVTDNGNPVVDCKFAPERDPRELSEAISEIPGVLEHGLFLGVADLAFIGNGTETRTMTRAENA